MGGQAELGSRSENSFCQWGPTRTVRAYVTRQGALTGNTFSRGLCGRAKERRAVRPTHPARLHRGERCAGILLCCYGQSPFGPLGPGPAEVLLQPDGTFRTADWWPALVPSASTEAGANAAGRWTLPPLGDRAAATETCFTLRTSFTHLYSGAPKHRLRDHKDNWFYSGNVFL